MNLKKYLGEGLLIVFSVLFALFINKTYEDNKTKHYKENALKQIKAELIENQETLKTWKVDHKAILENINDLIENKSDSIQKIVQLKGYLPIQIIFKDKSLMNKPLLNSAWSSAQSIGITSEFEFETLQYINTTYELQKQIMNNSIEHITERIFIQSTETNTIKSSLVEMRLRFGNLQGQEYSLDNLYKQTIEIL